MDPADGTGPDPSPSVVVIGGDGIGPEVVGEAVLTLRAAGFRGEFAEARAGWKTWIEEGTALPSETIDLIGRHRLCLFGAITSRPEVETAPLAAEGRSPWVSPILDLRRRFRLEVSIRPARSLPGVGAGRRSPDGSWEPLPVDLAVVRQNTEGLYAGVEWADPSGPVLAVLRSHPQWSHDDECLAVGARIVTGGATERAAVAAFELACRRGEGEVVLAEKPNVLRATSGLVLAVTSAVAERFEDVSLVPMNADAVLMEMASSPERFGVILTTNLMGDLISDAAAGLVGGPGFVPSANLGADVAVFEPVHGSAPDIAGIGTANPVAAILAAAMLADHAGQSAVAARIVTAVELAVGSGLPATTDAAGAAVRAALHASDLDQPV